MNYMMITEASNGLWTFENQTTACIITLTLRDEFKYGPSAVGTQIFLDYEEFEQLRDLIKKLE